MERKSEKKIVTRKNKTINNENNKGLTAVVYNFAGEPKREILLPDELFKIEVKPQLLATAIRVYLTNQRQGTAATKTRGEVKGSTKKIYRQKGTGRARHGDIKAPIFVGGGVVGGPKPRSYKLKLNKKQVKKALFGALSLKAKDKIIALDDSSLKIPKTKNFFSFLKKVKLEKEKILLIVDKLQNNFLALSARNLKNTEVTSIFSLNTYQILKADILLFSEQALLKFIEIRKNEN